MSLVNARAVRVLLVVVLGLLSVMNLVPAARAMETRTQPLGGPALAGGLVGFLSLGALYWLVQTIHDQEPLEKWRAVTYLFLVPVGMAFYLWNRLAGVGLP